VHSGEFPARLRHLRATRKLSQQALADAVGINRMSVNHYEHGNRTPSIDVAARLAEVLGVTVDELLGGDPVEAAIRCLVTDPPRITDEQLDKLRRALAVA
jgi:transcriptional regulator with XRE-family HTH domain